jgi:hypothetical protein
VKSRQEAAYELVTTTFIRLLERDPRIPQKQEVLAYYQDLFDYSGVRSNMILAFGALLENMDEKIQKEVYQELRVVRSMLGEVADPEDESTYKISMMLDALIAEEKQTTDYQTPEQLLAEVGDLSEVSGNNEDDTPLW